MIKILFFAALLTVEICAMPTFKKAMHQNSNLNNSLMLKIFEGVYEENNYAVTTLSSEPLIPKIIHQIWVGCPLPERYKKCIESVKKHHPDWEYKLWTEKDVKAFKFSTQKIYNKASSNQQKSDILRYEILSKFGGVYIDIDYECLKPLTPLVHAHEFFAGLEGPTYVNNAIIGSRPRHPICEALIKRISNRSIEDNNKLGWYGTGPCLITQVCFHYLVRKKNAIIYPQKFFYPLTPEHVVEKKINVEKTPFVTKLCIPETFGIHYCQGSFVSNEYQN